MNVRGKIILLTFFFAVCGSAAVWTARWQLRADENVKPAELYAIIDRQLGDLRDGDFASAYEYASSEIQERYSVDQFAAMVQWDYPGMTNASRAQYGPVETRGRRATLQVYLIGRYGEVMPCVYMMVKEGDSWRIDGARLSQPIPPELRMEGTML